MYLMINGILCPYHSELLSTIYPISPDASAGSKAPLCYPNNNLLRITDYGSGRQSIWFAKPIDFTDYSTLYVDVSGANTSSGAAWICICNSYTAKPTYTAGSHIESTGLKTTDISNITGEKYLAFAFGYFSSSDYIDIKDIYLI